VNSAHRLALIANKIKSTIGIIAFEVFENVFEVEGCIAVSNKLRLCEAQIDILEEKAHPDLIIFLRTIFGCKSLQRNISNERNGIQTHIVTLETVSQYMPEENIDEKLIKELSDALTKMRAEIDSSDTATHYKDVLYSFVEEMFEGIVDIEIGGVKAFSSHVEQASGKVILYNEAFKNSGFSNQASDIFTKSTEILSKAQTWSGALGFMGKFLGS